MIGNIIIEPQCNSSQQIETNLHKQGCSQRVKWRAATPFLTSVLFDVVFKTIKML